MAEEFGARHISVDRIGAGAARNAAMGVATGDYLAFLDDDDVWLPEHLRPQLSLLDRRPELAGVVGQVVLTDPQLVPFAEPPWPAALPDDGLLFFSFLSYFPQIGATVARISARDRIGMFDETLLGDQDWDWHLRLARAERVGFVQVPCVLFRQRAPGDEDELQKRRMHFTRKVFMRHALPAWREWDSPIVFLKYFNKSMSPYFNYFRGALHRRAERGDSAGVLSAMGWMLVAGPVHAARLLATEQELRRELGQAVRSWAKMNVPGAAR